MFLYLKGIAVPGILQKTAIAAALFALAAAEISRMMVSYKITSVRLIIVRGIIQQSTKNIHFHPLGFVPDISMKQNWMQRLLNYGSVSVAGSGEHSFELRNINQPHRVVELLQELIEENRTPSSKRRF